MNNYEIDVIIAGIDKRDREIKEAIKELTGTPDDTFKVMRLLELLGGASGELAFIRHQMLESKNRPVRKFGITIKK